MNGEDFNGNWMVFDRTTRQILAGNIDCVVSAAGNTSITMRPIPDDGRHPLMLTTSDRSVADHYQQIMAYLRESGRISKP